MIGDSELMEAIEPQNGEQVKEALSSTTTEKQGDQPETQEMSSETDEKEGSDDAETSSTEEEESPEEQNQEYPENVSENEEGNSLDLGSESEAGGSEGTDSEEYEEPSLDLSDDYEYCICDDHSEVEGEACNNGEEISPSGIEEQNEDDNEIRLNTIFGIVPENEIQKLIFDRLDLRSKLRARLVCKLWENLVTPAFTSSPILYDSSAKMLMKMAEKGIPIKNLKISKLKDFKYPENGIGFSSVHCIKFIPFRIDGTSLIHGISDTNLPRILGEFRDISELHLHSASFEDVKRPSILATVNLPNLKKLKISAYNGDGHGFFVCEDALKNNFPQLTSAYLSFLNYELSLSQFPLFYKESFAFLIRHHKTLQNLDLGFTNTMDEREFPPIFFEMDHPSFSSGEEFQNLMNGISNIQLTKLDLHITFFEGNSRHLLVTQLLNSQNRLAELSIKNVAQQNIGVWQTVPALLQRCYKTMKVVNISGCFCPAPEDVDAEEQFSCTCVKNCGELKELKLEICGLEITEIEDLPKTVTKLSLGQRVTQNQINFIVESLAGLEDLSLPQGQSKFNSQVPRLTVDIFRRLAKMPNLQKLILRKGSSSWKKIKKIISYTGGMETVAVINHGPGFSCIKFDRDVLDCGRI